MTDKPREDEETLTADTPSQGGSSGGELAREIGQRDEYASSSGKDPSITRVQKGDKAEQGDEPTLPNRQKTNDE